MTILLATHTEMYLDSYMANPPLNDDGLKSIEVVAGLTLGYIKRQGGKVRMILMGEGARYEDVFNQFKKQSDYECPNIITEQDRPNIIIGISLMLGGPSYRRTKKDNQVFSIRGAKFERKNCDLLSDCISVDQAWGFVEKKDRMLKQNEFGIFCSGRQQMNSLALGKEFKIASVFELDWQKRSLEWVIDGGKLVK